MPLRTMWHDLAVHVNTLIRDKEQKKNQSETAEVNGVRATRHVVHHKIQHIRCLAGKYLQVWWPAGVKYKI